MENQIWDATSSGDGQGAKVDKNRLFVNSVAITAKEDLAEKGEGFIVNTGIIALTSANESAVFFMKNNSEFTLILSNILVDLGLSTGGAGDLLAEVIKNPLTGTIVDNAINVTILQNKNASSPNGFTDTELLAFKGAEGDTITDGTLWDLNILPKSSDISVLTTDLLVLPPRLSQKMPFFDMVISRNKCFNIILDHFT